MRAWNQDCWKEAQLLRLKTSTNHCFLLKLPPGLGLEPPEALGTQGTSILYSAPYMSLYHTGCFNTNVGKFEIMRRIIINPDEMFGVSLVETSQVELTRGITGEGPTGKGELFIPGQLGMDEGVSTLSAELL